MREIKFRAWDGTKMLAWSVVRREHLDGLECDTWQWMQFTGLRDANGVEIFEGDILKRVYTAYEIGESEDVVCVGEVAWHIEEARFNYREDGGWCDGMDVDDAALSEVIGNIYEHPHLLENTNA